MVDVDGQKERFHMKNTHAFETQAGRGGVKKKQVININNSNKNKSLFVSEAVEKSHPTGVFFYCGLL